jgi:lipid-binding SYLF domain-containing protein
MQAVKRLSAFVSLFVMVLVLLTVRPCFSEDKGFRDQARETIELFKKTDPDMSKFFNTAQGYAVFPTVTKGGIGIGAARGRGLVYEQGKVVGEAKLTQGTIGAQIGGQTYSLVVFLEDKATMDSFKKGNFALSAQASATAAAAGASSNAKYKLGVALFTLAKGGLMGEASVGGQKFQFIPLEK